MLLASAQCIGCHRAASGGAVGKWRWLLALLLSLAAAPSWGQRPAPRKGKVVVQADTARKPLSNKQMEEALRLLLRADSVQQARVQPGMEADAEGFVLDQTITKPGRDFYEMFYGTFQSSATTGLGEYTIVLTEKPLRGNSSLISMSVNDTELLEMPLPTRTEQIEEAVAGAIETARGFLAEQQAASTQMETANHGPPAAKP